MSRVVLDPVTHAVMRTDDEYRERIRAFAGSLYEGLASLMTELVTLDDNDAVADGLVWRLYALDRDVWNTIKHIDERSRS